MATRNIAILGCKVAHPVVELQPLLAGGYRAQHRLPVHSRLDVGGCAELVTQHLLHPRYLRRDNVRQVQPPPAAQERMSRLPAWMGLPRPVQAPAFSFGPRCLRDEQCIMRMMAYASSVSPTFNGSTR